jgi:hypothetical protein
VYAQQQPVEDGERAQEEGDGKKGTGGRERVEWDGKKGTGSRRGQAKGMGRKELPGRGRQNRTDNTGTVFA